MRTDYGYNDSRFVKKPWTGKNIVSLIFALLFLLAAWFYLDQKLLFGEDWISQTYDSKDWRTNEGNLHTYGAWDFEAHVWKSEYIIEHWPNFQWNPLWYMGMPLLEYYQSGFYVLHIFFIFMSGLSAAKAALLLVVFGHLVAVLLTFLLCYKVSRRIWASALPAVFLLTSTFVSLRSYGWEPISIVFIFLYPLTLLFFLKAPTEPFRVSIIILLTLSYLSHPLIFFSLAMFMGLYLFVISLQETHVPRGEQHRHYIWKYFGALIAALCLGAIQFVPQSSYSQVTSGAHMGVSYIPFYHVPYNIISLKDFFLDAGNLKGPGFSVLIAASLLILFMFYYRKSVGRFFRNPLVSGPLLVLGSMVVFYYLERYNIFPMNVLRSIQYHRIIPEFIITAAVFISAVSHLIMNGRQKVVYYSFLIAFALSSCIVLYNVQAYWATTDSIRDSPEFISDAFDGRISFPYTDQSLSVRSSFTKLPQTYGYYEQGITNAYADEIFSVSSGFHSAEVSLIYLKAANVRRLYTNTEEGSRDALTREKFGKILPSVEGERYSYFEIPLADSDFAQAVDGSAARSVQDLAPECRVLFEEKYCGSAREEFVTKDPEELNYLRAYVSMLETPYTASADYSMVNPHHYRVQVSNATTDTAVILKMTYAHAFSAYVSGTEVAIERVGPDFMLVRPGRGGDYMIDFVYKTSGKIFWGALISVISLIVFILYFSLFRSRVKGTVFTFSRGDLDA